MFQSFMQNYAINLDTTMRAIVNSLADSAPGFGVMLRYPLGWVDADNEPYDQLTGKRIRPTLLLLCAEAAGGSWHDALPAAAAVELLHNFSLIHDDIQDNSPIRHGRPAVWKVWGLANAINAGDALFGLAYKALDNLTEQGIAPDIAVQVWKIFNNTVLELTRGQHLDMRFENQPVVSVEDYISMITGKSAALVAACTEIGSLIATGDRELAKRYAEFGINIGIAFQIRDDILGIWGDPDITGKSAATDIISHKKSLPVLYGLSRSEVLAEIYQRTDFNKDDVARAVDILDDLGTQAYAMEKESEYYQKAVRALDAADPQGPAGQELRRFVDLLFRRHY